MACACFSMWREQGWSQTAPSCAKGQHFFCFMVALDSTIQSINPLTRHWRMSPRSSTSTIGGMAEARRVHEILGPWPSGAMTCEHFAMYWASQIQSSLVRRLVAWSRSLMPRDIRLILRSWTSSAQKPQEVPIEIGASHYSSDLGGRKLEP